MQNHSILMLPSSHSDVPCLLLLCNVDVLSQCTQNTGLAQLYAEVACHDGVKSLVPQLVAHGADRLTLCRDTGYRVRLLTKERYTSSQMDRFRAIWKVDKSTVIIVFDPTAPNIFGYEYIGDNILLGPLRRPFWIELQSRFGNMFYVRDYVRPSCVRLKHIA